MSNTHIHCSCLGHSWKDKSNLNSFLLLWKALAARLPNSYDPSLSFNCQRKQNIQMSLFLCDHTFSFSLSMFRQFQNSFCTTRLFAEIPAKLQKSFSAYLWSGFNETFSPSWLEEFSLEIISRLNWKFLIRRQSFVACDVIRAKRPVLRLLANWTRYVYTRSME